MDVILTSPWVPREWIQAHGLTPRGVWLGKKDQPVALPEGVCAFAQEMTRLSEAHPQAAVVFTTACDQMRRAADAVWSQVGSRGFLFNLPATWQSPAARRLYHAEVARLGRHLETLGGRAPTAAELAAVMHEHEAQRAALRSRIQDSSARQAAEALATWFSGGEMPAVPDDAIPGAAQSLAGARTFLSARPPLKPEADKNVRAPSPPLHEVQTHPAAPQGVRLAIVGGPLLPYHWPLFDAISQAGGRVVLNATEPGERCLLPSLPAPAAGPDPLIALADHYFDHAVDVFHRPNTRLYAWLRPRLADREVRGIVLWHHFGCDLWRAEAQPLREAFGLPVLLLEADGAALSRSTNRLEAFLESLR